MKKYITELHCHTKESSWKCGRVPAAEIMDKYIAAGYSTIVITDHFGGTHVSDKGLEYHTSLFFEGYNAAVKANKNINVILGMEINLNESANDYLLYGITKELILNNKKMYEWDIKQLCEWAHNNGVLVYQAHPFRNGLKVIPPNICDGIEVFNAHPKHDSRNHIAKLWAETYNLNGISASDAHHPEYMALSGITTDHEIKNIDDLLNTLRNKNYNLITY